MEWYQCWEAWLKEITATAQEETDTLTLGPDSGVRLLTNNDSQIQIHKMHYVSSRSVLSPPDEK